MTTHDFHSTLAAVGLLHRVRDEELLQEHGLHAGQEFLLQLLWEEDGLTPGELSQRRGIETATATVTAQRMEQAGLVRRLPDPEDRRLVRVWLTDAGAALRGPVTAAIERLSEESLAGLDEGEREQLVRLLARVHANLARR